MREIDWNNPKDMLYDRVLRRLLNASFTDDQADAIIDCIEDILLHEPPTP